MGGSHRGAECVWLMVRCLVVLQGPRGESRRESCQGTTVDQRVDQVDVEDGGSLSGREARLECLLALRW